MTTADAELIKAHLNLYAILPNLDDLVRLDPEAAAMARKWDKSIQFSVRGGPQAWVEFSGGACRVGRGPHPRPRIKLGFKSPAHLNRMFDGSAKPKIRKGFTHLWFLGRRFPRLTQRLEHFLKPTAENLQDEAFLGLNTRFMLNTAAAAVAELAALDPIGKLVAPQIRDGKILLTVLPAGPSVHIEVQGGRLAAALTDCEAPSACIWMKDMACANAFLRGETDAFTAVASGDVLIKGQIPMVDSLAIILDRIPKYLEK